MRFTPTLIFSPLLGLLLFLIGSPPAAATGQVFDMEDEHNWNLRFDGPPDSIDLTTGLSYASLEVDDLNNDGEKDIMVSARRLDSNGREDSGSAYVIYSSLFRELSGVGNVIDLSNPANYNLRFDGAAANEESGRAPLVADLDNDGKNDLALATYKAAPNGRSNAGSLYIIKGTLLDDYSGTGNNIDLSNPASYNLRFDGAAANDLITSGLSVDIDGNDKLDLFILASAGKVNPATSGGNGYVYIISDSILDDYTGTGNNIDLAITSNWTTRINGSETTSSLFGPLAVGGRLTIFDGLVFADFDNDSKLDIIAVEPIASHYDRFAAGSLYLISNTLLPLSGTGNIHDLNNPTKYTIRYDGANGRGVLPCNAFICAGALGYFGALAANDIDGDGKIDLVFADDASNNGRPFSGSTYVIYNTLLDDYSGTGNNVDLANAANYNLRFDGAESLDRHTNGGQIRIDDLNNDGKNDLILGAVGDQLSEFNTGKIYVIFNDLIAAYTGTANFIDLADANNFTIQYHGGDAGDWLGGSSLRITDLNSDGQKDIVVGSWGTDYSDNDAGSLYVIYYFPHEIELADIFSQTSGNPFRVTGTVHAPDNVTTISEVEWGHDRSFGDESGEFFHNWLSCSPTDGAFDSNEEGFYCDHAPLSNDPASHFFSPHTIYVRARDAKGIYTAVARYVEATYTIDSPISSVSATGGISSANITWITSEPGSSQVEYGLTSTYGTTSAETDTSSRTTTHSSTLSGLLPCTTYHYRVRSRDIALNEGLGNDQTFLTKCSRSGGSSAALRTKFDLPREAEAAAPEENPADTKTPIPPELLTDLVPGDWALPYFEILASLGVFEDTTTTMFSPHEALVRAQAAALLIKALQKELPAKILTAPFPDVAPGDWFAPFALVGKNLGIFQGYPDGNFFPDRIISRAEAVKILAMASGRNFSTASESLLFSDLEEQAWYLPYLALAYDLKFIQGYADHTFRPDQAVTGKEFVKMLVVFLGI